MANSEIPLGKYCIELENMWVIFKYLYFYFLFTYLFSFIFISWRLITLQYCSGFFHTLI